MMKLPDSRRKKTPPKNEKKKHSRKFYVVIIALAAVAAAGILVALLFDFNKPVDVDQSKYSISYKVEAIAEIGCLSVEMNIDIGSLSEERDILLYKGAMTADFIGCTDEAGNEVIFVDTDELIAIGPVEPDTESLCFRYDAYIGEIDSDFEVYSIPYAQGCILEDLVAFSGEYAFLLPFVNPDSFDSIGSYIEKISFEFIVPDGLDPIIPYQTPIEGQLAFTVDSPDWDFFNTVSKSAFCFGQFERIDNSDYLGDSAVYVDKEAIDGFPQLTLDAIAGLLYYYSSLFDEPLDDIPIVLLRNLDFEDTVVTVGAGSGGSAMSAKLRLAEDVRALSNMVYHTFFDSKVKPLNLRYPGNNWIYRGLSEFYVGNSVGFLPDDVLEMFNIGDIMPMSERYLRYLYFSLKEPGFLGVSPIHETTGMYVSQEEFYMGVKVPLIIDAINYSVEKRTGQAEGFLRALISNGGSSDTLDVMKLLKEICGPDYDMIEKYLSGQALLTNYRGFDISDMPSERILYLLDEDEQKYAYFFETDRVFYPYSSLFLLYEDAFMTEAAKRGIRYNNDEIQNEVIEFSPVLHRLLLQYAMWASLAGVDDITIPNIKREITRNEIMEQWRKLCEEIGVEFRVEDMW